MNILVVSPHPDDETLGCGGTMSRLISMGHSMHWLNITSTEGMAGFSEEMVKKREKEIDAVKSFYSFESFNNLKLPSTKLHNIDESKAIGQVSDVIKTIEPDTLILPDYNDVHSDHRIVFDWCYSCSKVFRYPFIKTILTMEILSETDFGKPDGGFVPDVFVDITDYMDKKIEAMRIYSSELGIPPFPRSEENIRALATLRGGQAGSRYAEGFRLIKHII